MKQNLLENKISQTLYQFENLPVFEPSLDWNQSLEQKLTQKKTNSIGLKYTFLIIFLLIINFGFLIIFSSNKSIPQTFQRGEDLIKISNEIFISPNFPI